MPHHLLEVATGRHSWKSWVMVVLGQRWTPWWYPPVMKLRSVSAHTRKGPQACIQISRPLGHSPEQLTTRGSLPGRLSVSPLPRDAPASAKTSAVLFLHWAFHMDAVNPLDPHDSLEQSLLLASLYFQWRNRQRGEVVVPGTLALRLHKILSTVTCLHLRVTHALLWLRGHLGCRHFTLPSDHKSLEDPNCVGHICAPLTASAKNLTYTIA